MFKNYKKWFELKPKINDIKLPEAFHVNVGEVWWCAFGENIGVEIDGKGENFIRPALVVKFFNRQHIWVLPVTNTIVDNKFHIKIKSFSNTSSAVISQPHSISTKRLLKFMSKISVEDFVMINESLINLLQKETPARGGGISRPYSGNNGIIVADKNDLSNLDGRDSQ